MKKRLVCIGLALALLAGLSLTAAAEDLELPAPSCILMEKQTGQVLYESNAHEKLRPASVTKVMTLLLVMEALESGSIGTKAASLPATCSASAQAPRLSLAGGLLPVRLRRARRDGADRGRYALQKLGRPL